MATVFLVGLALNLMRPDLFTWITIFGAAFLACILATSAHLHWILPTFLGVICLTMATILFSDLTGIISIAERAAERAITLDPGDMEVQQLRDMISLVVVAGWMAVLAVVEFRRQRSVLEPLA
jgi:hypothetical protein